MKTKRHAMILKLIASEEIDTQEELARLLSAQGFTVTQATVSRDIKELRLIKVLTGDGLQERFIRLFSNCVVSITSSGNLIVLKTMAGSAAVAAEAIDSLKWPEIAGSIAGDNTIFVAVREGKNVTDLIKKFQKMMK